MLCRSLKDFSLLSYLERRVVKLEFVMFFIGRSSQVRLSIRCGRCLGRAILGF